ncbi:aryl hydrocarbon receptor 2 isoform X2 [Gallus gallus]|uniref:aryl hydrocarbon receptor 2 isoform X2 n=1 Tax=Gallus gallus TaxID=9031 RepID=UPI000739DBE8|nr:aryl hydrocarbon receptor 2 isoform X2 [Gallus gallus]|eukprot:XP_015144732.1 aryl hydrocarbon receptor 2 isoform X1 [Gallus gallus]
MLGAAGGMYAGRKRKKPVPRSPKPSPPEGVKSNPSKRHRDRLNEELNKLTGLLPFPEDACTRFDKLSTLRLAVGYLKVKNYLMAAGTDVGMLDQPRAPGGNGQTHLQVNRDPFPEGDLLLQSDLIYQSIYELIHKDDRAAFHCQLHDAVPDGCSAVGSPNHRCPERFGCMERNFTCRLRCLLDNSSGFLALNFQGRLKQLLGQQKRASDMSLEPLPLALFAIVTPFQPFSILKLQTKMLFFQSKHKLDFTPIACDSWGRVVLGYTEAELCSRGSGYQFVHTADIICCAESHVRVIKTGQTGTTVFRLLTKNGSWVWLQATAWLVYKGDEPDCIISRQRVLSNEEGEEHLRKRNLQLPFSFATGEAILYGNNFPDFLGSFQAKEEFQTKTDSHTVQHAIYPNSITGAMMEQDTSIHLSHTDVPQFTLPDLDAEPDGPSQDGKVGHDKDSSSLLVAIETLFEKSEVDGNISQSLTVGSTELQKWEDTLLSLDMEELPSEDFGERLSSELPSYTEQMLFREGDGKSMEFLHCSEEDCSVAQFQHWGFNPEVPQAFQAPWQPQAAGAQGQDAVLSLGSVMPEGSSAPVEQQILINPASLKEGMLLDALGFSSKPCAVDQLVNSGLEFQAGLPTSIPIDTIIPDCQSQSECTLTGVSCLPPLDSSTLVSQWHDVPVWAKLGSTLGQSTSPGGCPLDAWMTAPEQLEATGASLESQIALNSSSQSWGSFPRQPHCNGEQVLLSKDAWPQPQGLVLGINVCPGTHQTDNIMLHHYEYRTSQGVFRHGNSFLGDAIKTPTSALPCTNHPGTSTGLSSSCSASPSAEVGARASPCELDSVFPLSSLAGRQPLCACHVQLKVWGGDCRT